MNNVIEIHQMFDYLEEFFNNDKHDIVVGGMCGSFIFKHVIDAALINYKLPRILVIEGCQDYIGLSNHDLNNHVYYADLFLDIMCDPLRSYDPFKPKILNPTPDYYKQINIRMIENYDVIIINDTHLIPKEYVTSINSNFTGKICMIVDPYDIDAEMYCNVPTIVDSLNKLSSIIAMARSTFGVDTRAIDKSVKCSVNESKISRRSIGKIDDKQYFTNDPYLADIIRHRQLQSSFRKNQKLFVVSDKINTSVDTSQKPCALTKNSMCVIMSASTRPLMKLRIYSSKIMYAGDVTYLDDPLDNSIRVKPANILMMEESHFHKYKHSVLVLDGPVTQRQKYSILKNSNNVTVAHT